ncbi:MAG: glycosyltransferase family 4 protein [Chloroflexi bacterium]|nr:glycosyltransferase family 4 protein [Chloroflexota bacterium]MDL1944548.1 glycosyltransferase family 4 protein [Chloroflexi bacterium CFX2]
MKLAIIHEWLNVYGGSERLLTEILHLHPQAQLHALIHNRQNLIGTPLEDRRVKTSFLQAIPKVEHLYRGLLPLMPLAIESMNVRAYDVVLSISHAVSHGIKTNGNQIHISYVCTPMRYAWHLQNDYLHLHRLDKPLIGAAARWTLSLLRRWDRESAPRANHLLAISHWTAQKIQQAWGRDSQVIHPPVHVERFSPAKERGKFYIHVSRLVPYKMTAGIIKAFNELRLPLVIVGDGPEMSNLKKLAHENIQLLGHQPDEVVADLLNRAKAFVYMAAEDFGIAMVEAQAAGCPVIAYGKGGAAEIVRDGETGLLFQEQSSRSLSEAVLRFQSMKIKSEAARENAARFSVERFRREFTAYFNSIVN